MFYFLLTILFVVVIVNDRNTNLTYVQPVG